jgi:hypothetical protein
MKDANVAPEDVNYIECHGTGTILGGSPLSFLFVYWCPPPSLLRLSTPALSVLSVLSTPSAPLRTLSPLSPSPLHPLSVPSPSPLRPLSVPSPSPLRPLSVPSPSPLRLLCAPSPSLLRLAPPPCSPLQIVVSLLLARSQPMQIKSSCRPSPPSSSEARPRHQSSSSALSKPTSGTARPPRGSRGSLNLFWSSTREKFRATCSPWSLIRTYPLGLSLLVP